ncbi:MULTISPECIES: DMT family transporter [Pseudomonas]|uniref:DMT family transporter n=1 Tax=Pseudomonas quercus TaxID=2722792 RepID=A0ABX0YFW9_9PSED|nr:MULTISPECIES: DMT family transporter [Pseudomonas]MBF7143060.1 DMT family transporter [Pseudomonas sp. LY10J]NJP01911.1 DMT family transporter [Pseudomonas quercus]
MSIFAGLMTAVLWGLTDFLIGMNAKKLGALWSILITNAVSLTVLIPLTLIFWPIHFSVAHIATYYFAITASLLISLGSIFLCIAFKNGRLSVVAPLISTYGCFTTLFDWINNTAFSRIQLTGIVFCTLGMLLVSRTRGENQRNLRTQRFSVTCAIVAAFFWGMSFWIQGAFVLEVLHPGQMLFLNSILGFFIAAIFLFSIRANRPNLNLLQTLPFAGAGIINLAGFFFFTWGLSLGSASLVSVLSTLSSAIACLLAFLIFKEKMSNIQISGCLLAIFGVMLLGTH